MDNSELLESDAVDKLKPDLREGRDFKLVFEEAWTYLHRAYGGGPAITRRVVMQKDKPIVEIYPIVMHFRKSSEPNKLVNVTISIEVMLPQLTNIHNSPLDHILHVCQNDVRPVLEVKLACYCGTGHLGRAQD